MDEPGRPGGRRRPSREELAAASGRRVPDVIAPGLLVLFCGINPSLYSAAVGHHFARPGNRFWKALHLAGFTPRLLAPEQDGELPAHGLGVTNLVDRATAGAAEIRPDELRAGAAALAAKVEAAGPAWVAFLGIGAYRVAYDRPGAVVGPRPDPVAGARVWVLPNPSGLNAHYQLPGLAAAFAALRSAAAGTPTSARPGSRSGGPA
ncbi:MAG TPA: G/U mismatch-specific DNA glycosylase [Actinomycetota bacterium]|nr:G/U mismatch-specific DNA glycosylase [Actinomycetota bacterium]